MRGGKRGWLNDGAGVFCRRWRRNINKTFSRTFIFFNFYLIYLFFNKILYYFFLLKYKYHWDYEMRKSTFIIIFSNLLQRDGKTSELSWTAAELSHSGIESNAKGKRKRYVSFSEGYSRLLYDFFIPARLELPLWGNVGYVVNSLSSYNVFVW